MLRVEWSDHVSTCEPGSSKRDNIQARCANLFCLYGLIYIPALHSNRLPQGEMGTCTIIAISADLILIWRVWILRGIYEVYLFHGTSHSCGNNCDACRRRVYRHVA
ncbi:hypothetical protein B0H13DRAFT_513106 [Mycena leptocephala]|nr:hypothetical protein B0H13DRAFT_513106 [Mycena leptocephala]